MNGTEKGTWAFLAIITGGAGASYVVDINTWWIGLILIIVAGAFIALREYRKVPKQEV